MNDVTEIRSYEVEAVDSTQRVSASVRVTGTDRDHAIKRATQALTRLLGREPRFIVARRVPETREDKCVRCGRYVLAKETGLADVKTSRVWCKGCARFAK